MIDLASPFKESNGVSIGEPDLSFVNAAWVAQHLKLKPSFQEIVEVKAEKVVAEVNAWAETATRGLIRSLLTAEALKVVNEDTALILANALYFKETWAQLFDTSKTKQRVFHLLDGEKVHVPFMTSNRFERYLYNKFEDFKILKFPYKTSQPTRKFAMHFFLPDAKDGLKNNCYKCSSPTLNTSTSDSISSTRKFPTSGFRDSSSSSSLKHRRR
ncbi:hypothetical protein ES319_D11G065900v1 [Gossypium barbadense]|uniref:Serpin domain-containing protein n=1 Tax=Gossypium barbadense TaxID=3634 RepID=A0A5J5P8A4_GOSBA|nr:hypothetical protein ES319_D11G065900v1 [Gossypium barbadense]